MIKFYSHMVKPLRDEMQMTQESFAYVCGCGIRTIWHYEKNEPRRMKASVRDAMIRIMKRNGITVEQLTEDKL